jgi:hypothetical protein
MTSRTAALISLIASLLVSPISFAQSSALGTQMKSLIKAGQKAMMKSTKSGDNFIKITKNDPVSASSLAWAVKGAKRHAAHGGAFKSNGVAWRLRYILDDLFGGDVAAFKKTLNDARQSYDDILADPALASQIAGFKKILGFTHNIGMLAGRGRKLVKGYTFQVQRVRAYLDGGTLPRFSPIEPVIGPLTLTKIEAPHPNAASKQTIDIIAEDSAGRRFLVDQKPWAEWFKYDPAAAKNAIKDNLR